MQKSVFVLSGIAALIASPVLAGQNVPLPLAGAAGPIGLGIAVAGYAGYRLFKAKK